ncbi:MAG: hypothetical protein ACE15C_00480 [Phycisphaerae bacterium]
MKFRLLPYTSARLLKAAAGLLCLLAITGALAAQDEGPTVKLVSRVGGPFSTYAIEGTWIERTVTLANETKEEALIKFMYLSGDETYSRIVAIPAGAERRFDFAVHFGPLDLTGRPPVAEAGLRQAEEKSQIWDARAGRMIKQDASPINMVPSDVTPICGIGGLQSDSPSNRAIEAMFRRVFTNDDRLGKFQNIQAVANTPDRWYGYSMMPVVLLGQTRIDKFRASQTEALLDWVRRGGQLIIIASDDLADTLDGPIGQAAGVTAVGVHRAMALDVTKADGQKVATVPYAAPMIMAELCPDTADVLFYANGLPLLTRRAVGGGQVFTLATPLLGVSDKALAPVLLETRNIKSIQPAINENGFDEPARKQLNEIAGRKGPPRLWPTMLILGAAALSVLGGLFARRAGRGELVWLGLVPAAVLAGVGMFVYGRLQSDPQRLSYIGLAVGTGDGTARVQEMFAYGSGDRSQKLAFCTGGYRGVIRDLKQPGIIRGIIDVRTGARMCLPDQAVNPGGRAAFALDEMVQIAGPSGRLTFGEGGLTGKLTSGLKSPLEDAVVYVGRRSYRLGRIAAGGEAGLSIGPKDMLGIGEFTGASVRDIADTLREDLLGAIATKPDLTRRISQSPVLVGYISQSPLNPVDTPVAQHNGWCVMLWPLEVVPPAAGAKVLVPAGFVTIQGKHARTPAWSFKSEWDDVGNRAIDIRAALPPQVKELSDAVAHIQIRARAANYRMTVSGLRPGTTEPAPEDKLASFDGPAGQQPEIIVPRAERFRAADGSYQFNIAMEVVSGPSDTTAQWRLESVDVSLEGTSR